MRILESQAHFTGVMRISEPQAHLGGVMRMRMSQQATGREECGHALSSEWVVRHSKGRMSRSGRKVMHKRSKTSKVLGIAISPKDERRRIKDEEEGFGTKNPSLWGRSHNNNSSSSSDVRGSSTEIGGGLDSLPKQAGRANVGGRHSVAGKGKVQNGGTWRPRLPTVMPPMSIPDLLHNAAASGDQSLYRLFCDAADSFVTSFLTPLSHPHSASMDADILLNGICSPVDETAPTHCRLVRGTIPQDLLGGLYLRNGPNVASIHMGDGCHLFDGDGMLHGVSLKKETIYCSRYVQTSRFRQEKEAGRPLMVKVLGGMNGVGGIARAAVAVLRWLFGLFDLRHGFGLSNTNVCYFNAHIFSLSDDDMPYVIRATEDGDLITVRRFTIPSRYNMCAHPKFDPATGDLYALSLNFPFFPPFFPAFSLVHLSAADDSMLGEVPVPFPDVPLLHDFAVTPRFFVLSDHQIVMNPWRIFNGEMPLECNTGKTPRICLLPRHAPKGEIAKSTIFFDAPGINFLHVLNAWEEGDDEVVLIAPVLSPPERIVDLTFSSTLSEIRLNTKTRSWSSRALSCSDQCGDVELGAINTNYLERKSRYVYVATGNVPHLTGIIKVDLSRPQGTSAVVARRDFAREGRYGGEPCFVPAKGAVSEDDGYLLCIVGDEKNGASHFLIMDARSPSLEVIAEVELPSRVPPGFHGCFVTPEQMAQQMS